jgi:hypothetical protein
MAEEVNYGANVNGRPHILDEILLQVLVLRDFAEIVSNARQPAWRSARGVVKGGGGGQVFSY